MQEDARHELDVRSRPNLTYHPMHDSWRALDTLKGLTADFGPYRLVVRKPRTGANTGELRTEDRQEPIQVIMLAIRDGIYNAGDGRTSYQTERTVNDLSRLHIE